MGEHLPCKQGVKSSNLSVSSRRGTCEKEEKGTLKTTYGREKHKEDRQKRERQRNKVRKESPTLWAAQERERAKKQKVKEERARGECLGTKSRRKT